ncbi:MAG: DUF4365 domain-containing protein [Candidatus Eremiobacterota bacterium]
MKYMNSKSISEMGLNYVNKIVISNNCIYHEINQKNDVGIDIIIEFIKEEITTGKCIGVQVKSGKTYFNKDKCSIPINGHYDYWKNYSLPVFGIVYEQSIDTAYWIDIKKYLKENKEIIEKNKLKSIIFSASDLNKFDTDNFEKIFMPYVFKDLPELTFDEAINLFKSSDPYESYLGLTVLFKKYSNTNSVWKEFINYFRNNPIEKIPNKLIYFLSLIGHNPDAVEHIPCQQRNYSKQIIKEFDNKDFIKLLKFIDDETFISRGSLGQCIEAIISVIPDKCDYLKEIILDNKISLGIRERAAAIYAYYKGSKCLDILQSLSNKSDFIKELIHYIKENGFYNPYA